MARPAQSSQSSPPSRKRKSIDGEQSGSQKRARKQKFSHLAPKTKNISQDLIRAEWKALPKPAQQVVRDIFLSAKRTTLTQVLDGPRRREAEFVVNDVLRRLERQLPRMPFPPGTKAAGLELDGILESVRTLEAEKAPLVDSVKLLEEEIEREEQRVEAKRRELSRLQKDSKAAAKTRRHYAEKTHPLLKGSSNSDSRFDDAESVGLVASTSNQILPDEDDEDLGLLLLQLQNHLDTIKTNTEPLLAVDEKMLQTRVALTDMLTASVT